MKTRGYSLVEFLMSMAMATIILVVVTAFARNIFSLNLSSQASLGAQVESRKILNQMVGELRSASPSALGAYAIESAATSTITFFSDVNGDDTADKIRYYIDTGSRSIRRGVTLASGSPSAYTLSETVTTLMSDISNGTSTPLFDYYDGNHTGTSTALSLPVNLSQVRLIKVTVKIDKDNNRSPVTMTFTSGASLRNLKDNL